MLVNVSIATILAFSASVLGERIRMNPLDLGWRPIDLCVTAAPHMTKRVVNSIECKNGAVGTEAICVSSLKRRAICPCGWTRLMGASLACARPNRETSQTSDIPS